MRFVDCEKSCLSEDELQYAANDAHASVLIAHRLLNPVVHQPPACFGSAAASQGTATTAIPLYPPTDTTDTTTATTSIFSSLSQRLQAALVGTDTGNASGEEDEDDDEEAEELSAGVALRKPVVVVAAKELPNAWAQSSRTEPLLLPTCVSPEDRALLHQHCENLQLRHISIGG